MKKKLISVFLGYKLISTIHAECEGQITTRREIRDLSDNERSAYFNAVKQLHRSDNDEFTWFSSMHYNNVESAHGVPAFFPWHRQFISLYEKKLQAIDPSVVLPYWDWSIDSQAPEQSPIFTDMYLGGNGASEDNCVTQGTFSNWQASVPNKHCLKRNFDEGDKISAFYSPEALEAILSQSNSFDELRTGIEGGPHGSVHNGVGGNGGDFSKMYSANDPIFYLHHAFIDLLWSEWQARNPLLAKTYNGDSVTSSDTMIPFGTTVESTFDTSNLCYIYPRYKINLPDSNNVGIIRRSGVKSLDAFVKRFSTNFRHPKISPSDRVTPNKIRTPKPLPLSYIIRNHLNLSKIRRYESLLSDFTTSLNSLPQFVPKSFIPNLES